MEHEQLNPPAETQQETTTPAAVEQPKPKPASDWPIIGDIVFGE